MEAVNFLYLTQEDVIAAGGLDMSATLATVEEAFRLFGKGEIVQPIKPAIRWGPPISENTRGRIIAMPAYVGGDVDTVGIKWISSMPKNPHVHNLPRGAALIILNDAYTGMPLAVMDGTLDTHVSTLVRYDKIVVDDWKTIKSGAKHVSARAVNEGVISETGIHAELGEIVVGNKPGRENEAERILFNPIGMPVCDVSEATRIYRAAKAKAIGRGLPLWDKPVWV